MDGVSERSERLIVSELYQGYSIARLAEESEVCLESLSYMWGSREETKKGGNRTVRVECDGRKCIECLEVRVWAEVTVGAHMCVRGSCFSSNQHSMCLA